MLVIHGLVLFMVMNDNVVKTMPTTTTYLGTVFTTHLNGEIGGWFIIALTTWWRFPESWGCPSHHPVVMDDHDLV